MGEVRRIFAETLKTIALSALEIGKKEVWRAHGV
jgi:hypothetical protein